jgi:hypothetical protein
MNTIDKTAKIKEKLKVYQETDEYKNKLQFDLKFENYDDPVGIYTYEDELFVLTGDGWDSHIDNFDEETINEIYNQVCK